VNSPRGPQQPQAGLGTCPEPARPGEGDKRWSTTIDATHLLPYIQSSPGLPTRFRLDSVLSNTYNTPIWASATLEAFYGQSPDAATASERAGPKSEAAHGAAGPKSEAASEAAARVRGKLIPAPAWEADVPDEVVPLVPAAALEGRSSEALSVLSGTGDKCVGREPCAAGVFRGGERGQLVSERLWIPASACSEARCVCGQAPPQTHPPQLASPRSPAHWPNATFQLPDSVTEPGNAYRAQVCS
jgi:hypothetical protein